VPCETCLGSLKITADGDQVPYSTMEAKSQERVAWADIMMTTNFQDCPKCSGGPEPPPPKPSPTLAEKPPRPPRLRPIPGSPPSDLPKPKRKYTRRNKVV